ncbi:MAG: serine/threonine-protein kinase [Pseudomonadota bacterium]
MSSSFQPIAFGRYQLLELVAKGGMAEVFKARLQGAAGTQKVVCIKRILPRLSRNSEFISLFVREAKIVLPLTHGNITQVFDFGEVDGVYFLAMEYIRGQNLNQVLDRVRETNKVLDFPASLHVCSEICKGLQYAHSYKDVGGKPVVVVHRDVSPHNVLLSYNGEVKLTDFGIALAATKTQSVEKGIRGKPCYLSPEQVMGQSGDPRSDVFAMGAVLYEMLTGLRVFEGETDSTTLRNVCDLQIQPPSITNDKIDSELDAVVLKALAKKPEARYQKAGDLQVDLLRLLHKRAPSFTAEKISTLMNDLFAWELSRAEGGKEESSGRVRDRLLFQMSRAGMRVERQQASTEELLQMGTVEIATMSSPNETKSRAWLWAGIGAALVALGLAILFLVIRTDPREERAVQKGKELFSRGSPTALPIWDRTDHVTPLSLRDRRGEVSVDNHPTKIDNAKKKKKSGGKFGSLRRERVGLHNKAFLNCNSWPWSVVYLDGRRLGGNTPIFRVEVTPGKHQLKFVNPELQMSKEITVSVAKGQTKTVAVSLRE